MNSIQLDQEKMFDLSIKHLENNLPIFSNNKPLNDALSSAKSKCKQIKENSLVQSTNKKGIASDKNNLMMNAAKSAYKISNLVAAFASAQNNQTLRERVDYSFTTLTMGRESECVKRFRVILQSVKENEAGLAEYGLTEDRISTFEQLINEVDNSLSLPRQATTISSTATQSISILLSEMNVLFKETIDRLVLQYDESHPEFYYGYLKARAVIPGAGGRSVKTEPETPADQ